MTNENTEVVVSQQKIDLKDEARKQFHIATVDSLNCVRKPVKDFTNCAIDYLVNHLIGWLDGKLSA